MKILAISHSAVVGGYHRRFREVVRRSGAELTLLTPRRWRQFNRMVPLEKTSDPAYRVIARQPFTPGFWSHGLRNATHYYPGLTRMLRETRPDIIELWEEPFAAVTWQVIRAAKRTLPNSRIIFFSAQNIRKDYPPPFSWFERFTYRRADFAFVINSEAEKVIREKGWKKASLVLPLGVDPGFFRPADASDRRAELGLEGFTIGFVGKLERQKGILDLIRAVGGISAPVNLLVIGEGPLRAQAMRLAEESGLAGRARFLPAVPYDGLPGYLNCLDVLVLPSITLPGLKEQFGRVLVEAMSCAVPVIGSDSGEIPGVIGAAGLIFPEGDVAALRERIVALRENPGTAAELARKGRKRVKTEFAWESIARRQVEVYNRLLER